MVAVKLLCFRIRRRISEQNGRACQVNAQQPGGQITSRVTTPPLITVQSCAIGLTFSRPLFRLNMIVFVKVCQDFLKLICNQLGCQRIFKKVLLQDVQKNIPSNKFLIRLASKQNTLLVKLVILALKNTLDCLTQKELCSYSYSIKIKRKLVLLH